VCIEFAAPSAVSGFVEQDDKAIVDNKKMANKKDNRFK
jgi:hypothetical protein